MAPLSRQLSGIILPHDTYGSHLDASGKTIDSDLEEKNFFAAQEALSDVWSKLVIDNYPVECKALKKGSEFIAEDVSADWLNKHVKQSRYSLQIAKCLDQNCCESYETNWLSAFPGR